MPNIIEDLRRIMNARYGREVRQSIHDAIRDINNVADNAESVAITSQESAQNNATKAESYAVGGTGSRTGEDRDNAKYYKEEAERLAGVYAVEDNLISTSTIHSLSANQGRILNEKIGAPNGVASLDANGRVPSTQLPSYVDDVLEYASVSNFPATGESGKIYIALDTNKTYRWGGSAYVEISESLALGETSSTAYAGDKGKRNADDIDAIQEVIPSNASTSNKLATMADVGGGGHVLQNQSGTDMTQQPNMQFVDAQLADDATNERTTVEVVKQITGQELQSAPDGLYLIPDDGSGAVCDAEDVGFDNTGTDLTATNTEAAIKEVNTKADDTNERVSSITSMPNVDVTTYTSGNKYTTPCDGYIVVCCDTSAGSYNQCYIDTLGDIITIMTSAPASGLNTGNVDIPVFVRAGMKIYTHAIAGASSKTVFHPLSY